MQAGDDRRTAAVTPDINAGPRHVQNAVEDEQHAERLERQADRDQ